MKHNSVLKVAIASALLTMAVSAQATTVSTVATAPVFAKELLQGTTPNATALTIPAAKAIVVTSNVAIPANSTVYVYVKLNGASISTIPSVIPAAGLAATTISQADGTGTAAGGASLTLTAASLGSTTGTATPTAPGAGVDYVVFQVKTNTDVVGIGAELVRVGVATPLVVNNAASLLTAPLTATASIGVGAPVARFGALAASASNHDTTSAAANIATSAQGITLAATANTAATKIDLNSSPVASSFINGVSATQAQLGSFTATNGTAVQADGATAYTIATQAAAATSLNLAVAAPAGFFAALGTTGNLTFDVSATCAAGTTGTNGMASAVYTTAALAAAATSVAIPSTALPTTATPYYLCMNLPAISATSVPLVPGTPALTATLAHTSTAVDVNTSLASTNMLALTYNGSQYDVRNYVPAAATGYNTFVRVINTGAVSAAVSVALINETTGVAGPSAVLGTLAAGASRNFNPAEIEAATGAISATSRPRLRITAPTSGMNVQTFLAQPNGTISDMTGAQ